MTDQLNEIAKSLTAMGTPTSLEMLQSPQTMSKEIYSALQEKCESMGMDAAQGHDCIPGFYEKLNEMNRLMDEAPWTFSNDDGIVVRLDEQHRTVAPRA